MTKCNVKGDKPRENYQPTLQFLPYSISQLIVLVLQPSSLLFWFSLSSLISVHLGSKK